MSVFEMIPKNGGSGSEHEIVKKIEKEKIGVSLEELTEHLDWTSKLLEEYQSETDKTLKRMRFEALRESFVDSKLEDKFSKLENGDEDMISEQFMRLMDIKNTIENDAYLYEKKAA